MLRKTIDKILGKLLAFLLAVLVLDVLWQVFSRYVLVAPSSYTDECAGYLLIWVGVLGAAYVSGQKEHLAIDIILHKSGRKTRRILEILISVFTLLFALTVMVAGGAWLMYTRFMLEVTSASLELNMGYVYSVLPLSGGLIMYYEIDSLVKYKRDR